MANDYSNRKSVMADKKEVWDLYPGEFFPPPRIKVLNHVWAPPLTPEQIRQGNILAQAYNNKKYFRRKAAEWRKRWSYCEDVSISGLIDAGREGLLDAFQRYDPSRGVKLTTYASGDVDRYMLRYLYRYAVEQRMIRIDAVEDKDDEESYLRALDGIMQKLNEAVMRMPSHSHNIYTEDVETACMWKIENDELLHAISLLDPPNRKYMFYRYYRSPSKQRWESVRHFELADKLAKGLEQNSLDELLRYYQQKEIIALYKTVSPDINNSNSPQSSSNAINNRPPVLQFTCKDA